MTCRSEYFKERFGNFTKSSFVEKLKIIDNFESQWNIFHKNQLLQKYFDFFKLQSPHISLDARNILENDTLLLRMFCEAYGNPDSQSENNIPAITNIYRDKIFREYLERKVRSAIEQDRKASEIYGKSYNRYMGLFDKIAQIMVEKQQYSDILLTDIPDKYDDVLSILMGEDVIFRKDLQTHTDPFNDRVEVLNFTFDEFRDFILTKYLVNNIYMNNPQIFEELLDNILTPSSPIAEGVKTYLFYISKRSENQNLSRFVVNTNWYKSIFIKSIFSVEEEFINDDDIELLKECFIENDVSASWITKMLIIRWRSSLYPKLNISILFDILSSMNENKYIIFLENISSNRGRYFHNDDPIWIMPDEIAEGVNDLIIERGLINNPDVENLMELLIFLFSDGINNITYTSKCFEVFERIADKYFETAIDILSKYLYIDNRVICINSWKMIGCLSKNRQISKDIIDFACDLLIGYNSTTNNLTIRVLKEIARFLDINLKENNIDVDDIVKYEIQRISLISI